MSRKISFAIILALGVGAVDGCAPAIQPPSPTQVSQTTRVALTSTPAPTQPGTATPAPPKPSAQPSSPDCFIALPVTPEQTEGPYFRAGSPERKSLVEPGMAGTKITLTGFVMTRDCKSVARAKVDVWQADDKGNYDNTGYRLRGYVLSDTVGQYAMETILPGLYPGRTRHIHVRVTAPNLPVLSTQIYFPNEGQNERDSIFDRTLLVKMEESASGKTATFNFVLDVR